jgi:hypothetical protein
LTVSQRAAAVRAFRRDDITEVAALRARVFQQRERATPDESARYFESLFFHNPWADETLPSLVHEDSRGGVIGFVGVIPRRMMFRGEPVRVAISTQMMVAPEHRGVAGYRLIRALLTGAHDLVLSDVANDVARRVFEGFGGRRLVPYSVLWTLALRPAMYAVARIAPRLVARAVRPLCAAADTVAALRPSRRDTLAGRVEPLDVGTILAHLERTVHRYALRPVYDDGSLPWLLAQARDKRQFGELEHVLLRDAADDVTGWFLYYANPGGVSHVAQLAAVRGAEALVLDHLARHAWRRGSTAVSGRLEPALLLPLAERRAELTPGPSVLVHTRRRDILDAIHRGDAFLSRLDGEWWVSF